MFRSLLLATALAGFGAGPANATLTNLTADACPNWSMVYSPSTGMNWAFTLTNSRANAANPHGTSFGSLTLTPTSAEKIDVSIFPTAGQPWLLTVALRGPITVPPAVIEAIKAHTQMSVSLSIDGLGTATQTLQSLSFRPQPGAAPCP